MKPTVSVVVPMYNGTDYLQEALDSVLSQTSPPQDVLVIDDGSDEIHARRLDSILEECKGRVRSVRQKNAGPAAARNAGIAATQSDFVAFIDQDDLWHHDKLRLQLSCFEEHPEVDLCYACVDLFWAPELKSEEQLYANHRRTRNVPGYIAPTLLARRAAFEKVGPLDSSLQFGDGSEWAMRAIDQGLDVRLLPDVLLYHRMHGSNLTRNREASKKEFVGIVRARLQRFRRQQQAAFDAGSEEAP
ncbi:MAG: glycosyltransferase family A protein [Planctomycetota bacterium]